MADKQDKVTAKSPGETKSLSAVPSKRWRAEPFKKSSYWIISDRLGVSKTTDKDRSVDRLRYRQGNYFRTREQASDAATALQEVLRVIHKPLEYPETNPLNDEYIYAARRTPPPTPVSTDPIKDEHGN